MIKTMRWQKVVVAGKIGALCAITLAVFTTGAQAQEEGGPPPPPPGGGFGGPGGLGGPGGRGGQGRGMRAATIADVPVAALTSGLALSATQSEKLTTIQKQLQKTREENRPQFGGRGGRGGFGGPGGQGGPGGPGNGAPPDEATRQAEMEKMRENMDKLRTAEQNATRDMEAVLTDEQKRALPALLAEMDTLRATGIPLEVVGDLNLTADQKSQLVTLAKKSQEQMQKRMETARESGNFANMRDLMDRSRQQTRTQALAVLTDTQRATVKAFQLAHPEPQGGRGGFGGPGFGGPPPGGGFGGPPPGGGPGGPPNF